MSLKISNNIYLNLSQFSSILCGFPWLFPDFSKSVQNSLTFPWLENAFQFFQVFQSEWEPCKLTCDYLLRALRIEPCFILHCWWLPFAKKFGYFWLKKQEDLHKELQRPNKKVKNSLELQTVNVTIKISRVSISLRNVQNRLYFLNP